MFSLTSPISNLLNILTAPIHPTWFPIAPVPILHATRISLNYRSLKKKSGSQISWFADLVGFLMMSWGGSIGSHILLNLPIPQLLSFTPLLVYSTIYALLPDLDRLLSMKTLDSTLPLLDALLRTTSIASGVDACRNHPFPEIAKSLSIQLFIGAIASSGGGIVAQTLSVWEPSWRLNRPLFLQGSILSSTDVWSGALTAAIYGFLTDSHPAYHQMFAFLCPASILKPAILSAVDAKATAASILTLIYCWRAYNVHYIKTTPVSKLRTSFPKKLETSKSKNE